MSILLISLPVLLAIVGANLVVARDSSRGRLVFNLLLFLFNLIAIAGGVALLADPSVLTALSDDNLLGDDLGSAGAALLGMGLWGAAVSFTPVRHRLARLLPALDPDSAVHTLALAGSGYLVGNTLFTLLIPGGVGGLVEASGPANIVDLLAQQLVFVLAAFLGAGLLTRRDSESLNQRLGLTRPTRGQVFTGLRWVALLVIMQGCIGVTWAALNPEAAGELSTVNQALLGEFDTAWEWLLVAAASGLGEELLFRGAVQPIFGILPTSLVFALAHAQYGFSPATLTVFLLSVVMGIIRKRSNTTVAIGVHAGYNLTLGLLSLLAVSLQGMAGVP